MLLTLGYGSMWLGEELEVLDNKWSGDPIEYHAKDSEDSSGTKLQLYLLIFVLNYFRSNKSLLSIKVYETFLKII